MQFAMARNQIRGRVAVLGAGKIGGILLRGFLRQGLLSRRQAVATVAHAERAKLLSRQLKIPVSTDNAAAARHADILLVCVKPQVVRELLEEIRPHVTPAKLIVSVAASVPTSYIEKCFRRKCRWCAPCPTRRVRLVAA